MRRLADDAPAILIGALSAVLLLGPTASPAAAAFAALWWIPVVIIVRSDLDDLTIPDEASLLVAVLALANAVAGLGTTDLDLVSLTVGAALLNGAAAFALLWLIGRAYRGFSGREGLGFGDVKLAAASALWLGPADGVVALEIAALGALTMLVVRRRGRAIREIAVPFGAFLAPAAWLTFVAGPAVRLLIESAP